MMNYVGLLSALLMIVSLARAEDFAATLCPADSPPKGNLESYFKGVLPKTMLPVFAGGWDARVYGVKQSENGEDYLQIQIKKNQNNALRFQYLPSPPLEPGKKYRILLSLRNTPMANVTLFLQTPKGGRGLVPPMEVPYMPGWRTYSAAFTVPPSETEPELFFEFGGCGNADLKTIDIVKLSDDEYAAATDKLPFTCQPNLSQLNPDRYIPDAVYRYLLQKPFLPYSGKGEVASGFIGFIHRPAYAFYQKYFNEGLPPVDFLELRGPVHFAYCKTPQGEDHMAEVLAKAAAVKEIGSFQMTMRAGYFSDTFFGPEWDAKSAWRFITEKYGFEPVCMQSSSGISTRNPDAAKTLNYSRFDPKTKAFMLQAFQDAVKKSRASGFAVNCWNFGWPNENDWWIPINSQFYDYSLPAADAFREWCRKKYDTLSKLNAAWGSSFTDWREISPPPPCFGQLNLHRNWQDWQDFRYAEIADSQQDIINAVRQYDRDSTILYWMTSGIATAGRDQMLLDNAMLLTRKNPNTLSALTCFDYYDFNGELYGQLALAYGVKIGMEPVRQDYRSFLRSFYNCLRFPVRRLNWLFQTGQNLRDDPQLIWVMQQRGVLNELAGAELRQSPAAVLFSYSDVSSLIREQLWHRAVIQKEIDFFQLLQSVQIQTAMISDHSLEVDLGKYRTVIIPEIQTIRPAMIAKLAEFAGNGGTVLLLNRECGAWNMDTGEKDYPLFAALGVPSNAAAGKFAYGKGSLMVADVNTDQLRGFDGELNDTGVALLRNIGVEAMGKPDRLGCSTFLKQRGKTFYLGVINLLPGRQMFQIRLDQFAGKDLTAVELISGETQTVKNGIVECNLMFRWQFQVFRIE